MWKSFAPLTRNPWLNMKYEKETMLTFGISIGLFSNFARLGTFGFFYPIGLISVLLFATFHVIFLNELAKYFKVLSSSQKLIAYLGILTYPLIFIFQFDLEEFKDAFYVYEHITGEQSSDFEYHAFYIAILAGLVYMINYIIWRRKLKNTLASMEGNEFWRRTSSRSASVK